MLITVRPSVKVLKEKVNKPSREGLVWCCEYGTGGSAERDQVDQVRIANAKVCVK